MKSVAWKIFIDTFFGDPYMAWHDGLNPGIVKKLNNEERQQAEDMLIKQLSEQLDYRAAIGLGEMLSQKAVPFLKQASARNDRLGVEAANAVFLITRDPKYINSLIRILRRAPSSFDRFEAAIKLRQFNIPKVVKALYKGLEDEEYLVRYHCANSLLSIYKIHKEISEIDSIFKYIISTHFSKLGMSSDLAFKKAKKDVTLAQEKLKLYIREHSTET